jgi:hypothetical protein
VSAGEREILAALDRVVRKRAAAAALAPIVARVERKLAGDPSALLAWEPAPLEIYGEALPEIIRSSWVFVLRGETIGRAERHPNSHQRVMSYRGIGDLQTRDGAGWQSNVLVSDPAAPLEERWLSIPVNVWHKPVVDGADWTVVSFHTVLAEELIEECPDAADERLTRQRRYLQAA